jgi:hypothetical protein
MTHWICGYCGKVEEGDVCRGCGASVKEKDSGALHLDFIEGTICVYMPVADAYEAGSAPQIIYGPEFEYTDTSFEYI